VTTYGLVLTLTSEEYPGPPPQYIGMDSSGITYVVLTEDIAGSVVGAKPKWVDLEALNAAGNEEASVR